MIWLYAVLFILILIIILILSPLHLIIRYRDGRGFKIKIKLLCFSFNLYSESSRENSGSTEKKSKEKTIGFIPDIFKKRGIIESFKLFSKILNFSGEILKKAIRGIVLNKMRINMRIGASDAASTAIKYGQASALLYPLAAFITSLSNPKEYSINIAPDFLKEKISVDLELDISARVFRILFIFLAFAKKYSELI